MRAAQRARSGQRLVVLRALLRERRRLLLAGLSIALGVGYLAGTLGLLGRIGAGLDELAAVSADDAEIVVEGEVAYESPLEKVRRLVPAALVDQLSDVDGVASVSHRVEGTALVLDGEGEPVASPGLSEQPLLTNWPEDPAVSNLALAEGRAPDADSEVLLDEHTARVAGVGIGDEVGVAGKGKIGDYEVVGIAESNDARSSEGSSLAVMTTDESRLVLDQPTDDNRIAIRTTEGADVDQVMADVAFRVGPGSEVTDGATAALHAQESLTRSFTLIRVLVTGFGVLALLVGMVTVANSLTLLHAQRRRVFASFRLVGASRGQLRRAALGEAVVLALVASVVGVPLGLLLALLIELALGTMGTAVPTTGPLLTPQAAAAAVGIGLLATLAAAWRPVRNACAVAPIEAISEGEPPRRHRWSVVSVVLSRAAVLAVAAGAVAVIAGASPRETGIAAGAVLAFVAVLGFLPALLTRVVSATIRALPLRPRPLRVVAARDALRNPRRTAATTAAVLVAAGVVTALAVFLDSFTASLDDAVDDLVSADLVVDSETFTRGGLPADLVEQLGFLDGVEASSGWQLGRGNIGDVPVRMTGLDGEAAGEVLSLDFVDGDPGSLNSGSAWISAPLAAATGLGAGDELPTSVYSGGFVQLSITGVYDGGTALLGDVVTDRDVLMREVPATRDLAALVSTDGSEAAATAVEELAASYGVTAVTDPEQFVGDRGEVLRGFERVVLWMLLFTLLQALVGVVNTLVLSVGERRREFGLLRVAGTSRRALMRMVLLEGVSFSSVGTLLGIAAGAGAAALAVWALGSLGLGVFSMPLATVVTIALVALVVGVAASWIPARMAARIPPLDALADTGAELRGVRRPAAPVPVAAPVAVPVPAAPAPAVAPAPAPTLLPPPFDPTRLPAPVLLDAQEPLEPARVLSVAVLDGSSVTTLAADSREALALLELYDLAEEAVAPTAPQAPTVEPAPVAAEAAVPDPAVPDPAVPDPAANAIGMLLSESLFAADETSLQAPLPTGPAPDEAGPTAPEVPAVTDTPMPPPFEGTWEDLPAGPEPSREQRRGLRRSRRRDPADRRPPRRVRRGSVPGAAEGWIDPGALPGPTGVPGPAPERASELSAPAQPDRARSGLVPEDRDLAAAVRRLDAHTQQRWSAVLHSMNAALANGEEVDALVCGRVQAAPAAVTRTDRRLLVVAERPGRMAVESLHPVATGVVVRPGPGGTVVVVLVDRGRPLEVTDVSDTAAAEALVRRDALRP